MTADTCLNVAHAPFQLCAREVAVAMVHCLKLAPVYRNERFSEKVQALAQHNDLAT
jgi:hypothetical protein